MIKLGVDNGNYNTKSSEGMLYASGYAASDKEFITPEMQLFFEGIMPSVSGGCISSRTKPRSRMPLF
nr:hypothetical protein [Clostridium sp. BNL1100]